MGKRVTVAFADRIPTMYRCLPGIERIVPELPTEIHDVAILLECDSIERTGFERIDARMIVNIDHHQSGRSFADFNWIDPTACAVGVMVYQLAVASGEEITSEMAGCLYAAVLTDTGAFTFACTDSFTFGLAEHLLERGADSTGITQAIYFSNPESKIRLLGAALSNLEVDGEVAWTYVTLDDMERANAIVEDCEGIVNYLISILGVRAAVFLRELPAGNRFRLNLRSKGYGRCRRGRRAIRRRWSPQRQRLHHRRSHHSRSASARQRTAPGLPFCVRHSVSLGNARHHVSARGRTRKRS